MIDVFISHSYKDKPLARKIAKELDKYGIRVWIDESEIKLGDSLIDKIRDGLEHMDFLIALVSENSVHSEWVKKELDIAMNKEIDGRKVIVIPILAGKCELPGFLKGKLYADMSTTRKFNENIPVLIRRFNIHEMVEDDKNEFTEYKLSSVQVIEKLENIKNENETIELIESLGYFERSLFYRDTFIQAVNKLLEDEKTSLDVLISLIDMCKYCPDDVVIKLSLTKLLDRSDEQILQSTINVLRQTKSLKIQQKRILKILKDCKDGNLEDCIWDYFLSAELDSDVAKSLWEFIQKNLKTRHGIKSIMCMCKLSDQLLADSIFKEWYTLWSQGNETEKREYVNCLCQYGFRSGEIYLFSPKLRDHIREALLNSFGEDDEDNAKLMIALLTCTGNLVERTSEIWDKFMALDEYSILFTLEMLRDEYNIAYIFDSPEDVAALKGFVESDNRNIKNAALDIMAEIRLKESLEIINDEKDFSIQHYNAGSLLYTLLKVSDVKEYRELYERVKEKIENGYYRQAERNLILYAEYLLGNIDVNSMIDKIQIVEGEMGRHIERQNKLLVEKLQDLSEQCDDILKKKIQELIKGAKSIS